MQALYSLDGLFAACCLGNNFYITLYFQQAARPFAYQCVIVRQNDADLAVNALILARVTCRWLVWLCVDHVFAILILFDGFTLHTVYISLFSSYCDFRAFRLSMLMYML